MNLAPGVYWLIVFRVVQAIGAAMKRLRLGTLLDRKASRERDLALAMIAAPTRKVRLRETMASRFSIVPRCAN